MERPGRDVPFPGEDQAAGRQPLQEHLTQEILYILWDCGLKVGHSTRTVDAGLRRGPQRHPDQDGAARGAPDRGLAGALRAFAQAYRNFYTTEAPKDYIAARLEDQAHRRAKFSDTVFNQEPDVKNGVGGLRDYQNALWMARVKLGIRSIDELATQKYLKPEEVRGIHAGL